MRTVSPARRSGQRTDGRCPCGHRPQGLGKPGDRAGHGPAGAMTTWAAVSFPWSPLVQHILGAADAARPPVVPDRGPLQDGCERVDVRGFGERLYGLFSGGCGSAGPSLRWVTPSLPCADRSGPGPKDPDLAPGFTDRMAPAGAPDQLDTLTPLLADCMLEREVWEDPCDLERRVRSARRGGADQPVVGGCQLEDHPPGARALGDTLDLGRLARSPTSTKPTFASASSAAGALQLAYGIISLLSGGHDGRVKEK